MSVGQENILGGATSEERDSFIDSVLDGMDVDTTEADEQEDTSKETTSVDDEEDDSEVDDDSATEDQDGDDDVSDSEDEQDWLDDELRDQAVAIGFTDEQLSEVTSRAELERAFRIYDLSIMQTGRNAGDADGEGKTSEETVNREERSRDSQGRFTRSEGGELDYEVGLNPEDYGEAVVKEFDALHKHYAGRFQELEDRLAAFEEAELMRAESTEQQQFDSVVDSLGYQDLFGESGNETKKQMENRKQLWADFKTYATGLRALGREGRTDKSFVARVFNMTFADYLSEKRKQESIQKAKKQSSNRTGSGKSRSVEPKYDGPVETDPELLELHKELAEKS